MNINLVLKECIEIDSIIKEYQEKLQNKINELKKKLPKGFGLRMTLVGNVIA